MEDSGEKKKTLGSTSVYPGLLSVLLRQSVCVRQWLPLLQVKITLTKGKEGEVGLVVVVRRLCY